MRISWEQLLPVLVKMTKTKATRKQAYEILVFMARRADDWDRLNGNLEAFPWLRD